MEKEITYVYEEGSTDKSLCRIEDTYSKQEISPDFVKQHSRIKVGDFEVSEILKKPSPRNLMAGKI